MPETEDAKPCKSGEERSGPLGGLGSQVRSWCWCLEGNKESGKQNCAGVGSVLEFPKKWNYGEVIWGPPFGRGDA